jgi:glucose-1-phosphate adenylyltransferase
MPQVTRWPVRIEPGKSRAHARTDLRVPASGSGLDVLTILLAGGAGERLRPLTRHHAKPVLPFGGIYRLIDVTLSNCVNSGLRRIYVLTQHKALSLNRHLRDTWNILPVQLGEFIEVLPPTRQLRDTWYLGTADAVYQNIQSIEEEQPSFVLILSADHVYKMDYLDMLRRHMEEDADVTVATSQVMPGEASRFGIVDVEADFELTGFAEKPRFGDPESSSPAPATCRASMGVYLFSTQVLLDALREDAGDSDSDHDFGRNVLPGLIGRRRIVAYDFTEENPRRPSYWRDVGTLDAYYEANMDLLGAPPVFDLYDRQWPIHTTPAQCPPARFVPAEGGTRMGGVFNSLVSHGCVVFGSRITNSVLSPGVRIHSDSEVDRSVLLSNVILGRGSRIRHAIVDRNSRVPAHSQIGYDIESDRRAGHLVTDSGIVVVRSEAATRSVVNQETACGLRVLASGA